MKLKMGFCMIGVLLFIVSLLFFLFSLGVTSIYLLCLLFPFFVVIKGTQYGIKKIEKKINHHRPMY